MSADLQNVFSWSYSAAADFEACRRKRYWSKYGSWGGWSADAPGQARVAYRLNKMSTRYALLGDAVEAAVRWTIRRTQEGAETSADDAYEQQAKPFLTQRWRESRSGAWKENAKKFCCLQEHYYGRVHDDKDLEHGMVRDMAAHARTCLVNFVATVLPRLKGVSKQQEVTVTLIESGDPEWFPLEGVKVYAIPDYVYVEGDTWHVHDWKSGKLRGEHQDQVAVYGLWAHIKHRAAPENIRLHVEYLAEGREENTSLASQDLAATRQRIGESVAEMAEYLVDADIARNQPIAIAEWDMAAEERLCRQCKFLELCAPEMGIEGLGGTAATGNVKEGEL